MTEIILVPQQTESNSEFRWEIIWMPKAKTGMVPRGHDPERKVGVLDATVTVYGKAKEQEEALSLLKEKLLSQEIKLGFSQK